MKTHQNFLGIKLPIIQAPMAGVQGSALAIAVSNAGGLGSLPCAMLSLAGMRAEIAAVRAGTSQPFNVNFFCHTQPQPDAQREADWRKLLSPYYHEFGIPEATATAGPSRTPFNAEAADLLEELKPPVVSFHFGLPPDDLFARVKAVGCTILASATTVDEALWLEARGVDAIIAQGIEAGGHRGNFLCEDLATQLDTFTLLSQIVASATVPVIAAGGIVDRAQVSRALALGAVAVQAGTAYLLCPEATTSPVHRAALKSAAAHQTAVTNLFSGRPARGIMNRLMTDLGPINAAAPAFPLAAVAMAPLRAKAESQGNGGFSPLWCGQNPTCLELPAAEVTRLLASLSS